MDTRGITFARVGGNSTVANLGGTVSFQGTANEVTVGESSGTFTIGLPSSIVLGGSADIDQIKIFNLRNPSNCLKAFKINNLSGLMVFLGFFTLAIDML